MELEKELKRAWELGVAARLLMKREVQQICDCTTKNISFLVDF